MDRNVKMAKDLVKMARELVAMSRFTDEIGQDTGTDDEQNTNSANDRQYEEILRKLYPNSIAQNLINMGRNLDIGAMHGGLKGTMGNGNMYLKYNAFPREKKLIIMGFVSKTSHLTEQDKQDVYNLFKFLEKQVENGYTIITGCNRYSLPFLTAFARKNNYYFRATEEFNEFGNAELNENNLSRNCICRKRRPNDDEGSLDRMFSTDSTLDKVQRRREEGLLNMVNKRDKSK